jgi:trk/ktr system potassium uptake protein
MRSTFLRSLLTLTGVLGRLIMVFSLLYLLPIGSAIVFADGTLIAFVAGMGVSLGLGTLLYLPTRRRRMELRTRDGFMLVALAWTLLAAIATLPLILAVKLSFTHALFETMSGLTTTCATVMVGLDQLPASLKLWRHELNWVGGMGIIVLAVAILPILGVGGMQLMRAEVPGPVKDTKLTARIGDTAAALWIVYVAITAACILGLHLVGMRWFDAICHAFSTLSLGGFSTRDASVGAFDSPAVEAVLMLFMVLAALNFASHFNVWRTRSLRPYLTDAEAIPVLGLLAVSSLGCAL